MPDESHLGGFAAADDVLEFLYPHLPTGSMPGKDKAPDRGLTARHPR